MIRPTMVKTVSVFVIVALSVQPSLQLIGALTSYPGQFPYIAALKYPSADRAFCGGTIINQNWVLTAAQCINSRPIESIEIVVGTNIVPINGTIYKAATLIQHPNFEPHTLKNDIALIQIDGKFEFNELVQPIGYGAVKSNESSIVAAWGMAEDTDYPLILRYFELGILSYDECQADASKGFYFGPEQVCAYGFHYQGVCEHDAGAPLVSNGKLIGIVSYYQSLLCAGRLPDIYTRLSAYTDWIAENMQ